MGETDFRSCGEENCFLGELILQLSGVVLLFVSSHSMLFLLQCDTCA